jgi:hypothetical protein
MPIYAEYNNQNIVFAVTESAQAPVGNFIVVDSFDVIGWVKNGDTIEPAPVVQQYKTEGITRTEWIGLFTGPEITLSTKTRALLENMSADFSYLSGGAFMPASAIAIGRADATYRDLLRDVFFHFDSAAFPPGISVLSATVGKAMALQVFLGLLTQARADEIVLGVPL